MPLAPSRNVRTPSLEFEHQRRRQRTSASWITSVEHPDLHDSPLDGHESETILSNIPTSIIIDDSARDATQNHLSEVQQPSWREPSGGNGAWVRTTLGSKKRAPAKTSEHTTIVHTQDDHSSPAEIAKEAQSSFLDSHQSAINSKRHQRPAQSTLTRIKVRSKPAVDDLRRQAERSLYEQTDEAGVVRRTSMIRSVSKEDYLLARGANPRTGLVTPSAHSASSSFDEVNTMKTRAFAPPGRWRQRGNEWISLDLDQPTPVGTPPCPLPPTGLNGLRTPQRLTSELPPMQFRNLHAQTGLPNAVANQQTNRFIEAFTPTGCPGTYPQTPQDKNQRAVQQNAGVEHSIRRKPVGSSPAKTVQSRDKLQHKPMQPSSEVRARPVDGEHSTRSSSAPMPSRPQPFSPADVGKELPAIPGNRPSHQRRDDDPFLDQQPDMRARVHSSGTLRTSGRLQEKELPCLPTSNGLYRSMNPGPEFQTLSHEPRFMLQTPRVRGPRDENRMDPHVYMRKPRQMQLRMPGPPRRYPQGARPMPVPVYDNPPAFSPNHGPPLRQHLDVMTRRPHLRRVQAGCERQEPSTTIFTSTNTFTDMTAPQSRFPISRPPRVGEYIERGRFEPTMNGEVQRSMNVSMNMDSNDVLPVPVPRKRPRAASRPQMPSRAGGLHAVPKIDNLKLPNQSTSMAVAAPLNQTGTQIIGRISEVEDQTEVTHSFPLPTKTPSPAKPAGQPNMHVNLPGLMRKCSKCNSGFDIDKQHSTDQVGNGEDRLAKAVGLPALDEQTQQRCGENPPKSVQDSTMLVTHLGESFSDLRPSSENTAEIDERDHATCCQICCKEQDCHEGCSGHPSPGSSPARSARSSNDILQEIREAASSEKESEAPSTAYEKARKSRLAFVKHAFKRSFDRDRGSGATPSTPTPRPTRPANPLIELSAQPLSPATFWGGDGAGGTLGAIAAAKTAIERGSDTCSEDIASASRPVMSRKEKRKKPTAAVTMTDATDPSVQGMAGLQVAGANEGRRVTNAPALRIPTPAGSVNNQHRNVSGASIATTEIAIPGFGPLGFGAVWEMMLVPLDASKMWIRNHPRVMTLAWGILERGWDMGRIMTITGSRLWGMVFVYSKTGKLRFRRGDTAGTFVLDCTRSVVYLLIFMGMGVCVMRMLAWIVSLLRVGFAVINGLMWMVKKLLGQGLLW